jgi:hypothetical protein
MRAYVFLEIESQTFRQRLPQKTFYNAIKLIGLGKKVQARVALDKLRVGMFEDRSQMQQYQRRLLGEITDPEENFMGTIADLAEFKAVDQYFAKDS